MNQGPIDIVRDLTTALEKEADALASVDAEALRLATIRKAVLVRSLERVPPEAVVGSGGAELRSALTELRSAAERNAALLTAQGEAARELIADVNRRVAATRHDGTYAPGDLLRSGEARARALPAPDGAA